MISGPLGFFEMELKLVRRTPRCLAGAPWRSSKGFDAINMSVAPPKFIFMVMHTMMFEPGVFSFKQ